MGAKNSNNSQINNNNQNAQNINEINNTNIINNIDDNSQNDIIENKDKDEDKDKDQRKYIWIDQNIENTENQFHYIIWFKNKNIECEKFTNVDEAFNYLNGDDENKIFKEYVIIISGRLFYALYEKMKDNLKKIKFCFKIVVFCGEKAKELLINRLKMNNNYYFNNLFDVKSIYTLGQEVSNFLENKIEEENDLTFDVIENIEQLIIPTYYQYLIEDVNQPEINYFNDYILRNFLYEKTNKKKNKDLPQTIEALNKENNKVVQNLINQINNKILPKEIIVKYWLRIYTIQSEFFTKLNKSLRNKNKNAYFYYPFIKLCYEGIRKGFLESYTKEIYRASRISKEELEKLKNFRDLNKNKIFPKLIVFSRAFLSFTSDIDQTKAFGRTPDKNSYLIIYKIKEINNEKNKQLSNAQIENFSFIQTEKEVLLFPFSCFEIVDIEDKKVHGIDYEIHLQYLGNYSEYIIEQFGTNFFDKIQISNFAEEFIDSGFLKIQNFFSIWMKAKQESIEVDKICFFLEGEEDLICFSDNMIFVYNIYSSKIKQVTNIHEDKIINIIPLPFNRICSFSKDKTIKIIQFFENNRKFKVLKDIYLKDNYATQIAFCENESLLLLDNENNLKCYALNNNNDDNPVYNEKISKDEKILKIKRIIDINKLIYLTENNKGDKYIKFINLSNMDIEKESIEIKEKEDNEEDIKEIRKLKLRDIFIFYDYILITFDFRIYIYNYKSNNNQMICFKYFDYKIKNIIILCSNRLILGLYDYKKNISIIREHLLRIEDLQNGKKNFDYLGEGTLESKKIKNIIKINESKILTNIKKKFLVAFERKSEVSELLKEKLNNYNELIIRKKQNNFRIQKYELNYIKKPKPIPIFQEKAYKVFVNHSLSNRINMDNRTDFDMQEQYKNHINNINNTMNNNIINSNINKSLSFEKKIKNNNITIYSNTKNTNLNLNKQNTSNIKIEKNSNIKNNEINLKENEKKSKNDELENYFPYANDEEIKETSSTSTKNKSTNSHGKLSNPI